MRVTRLIESSRVRRVYEGRGAEKASGKADSGH